MNESDPIVAEVRRIRDEHAAKFGYDPKAIFTDIKELERRSGRTYVSYADETKTVETNTTPNQTLHQTPRKAGPLVS